MVKKLQKIKISYNKSIKKHQSKLINDLNRWFELQTDPNQRQAHLKIWMLIKKERNKKLKKLKRPSLLRQPPIIFGFRKTMVVV